MKVLKEWFISAPWGKIAMMSWGNPSGPPILLAHGREDSLATFIPLLELLPDKYHYVGVDLPGHGKSDPFPTGLVLMRFHFTLAVEQVVKHLGWDRFIYLAHSMGMEHGLFFNVIHPGRILKFIFLDPGPAFQRLYVTDPPSYYKFFHERCYKYYEKYNNDDRIYTRKRAMDAVMKARGLNETQAELVLERNLRKIGEDQYKLSWDRRLKFPAPFYLSHNYYYELFSKNLPPTLVVAASSQIEHTIEAKRATDKIFMDLEKKCKNFFMKNIEGSHDVHITNPERFAKDVCSFLERDFGGLQSKL